MRKLLFLLVFCACQQSNTYEYQSKEEVKDSISIDSLMSDSLNKTKDLSYEYLKGNFIQKTDEFEKITWYHHKNIGLFWLKRNGLVANLNNNAHLYLESNYYSVKNIFHKSAKIKIDSSIFELSNTSLPKTDYQDGYIYEIQNYDSEQSLIAIKEIAKNYNKPIKLRFIGSEFYDEFELSDIDKKAIRDTYYLYIHLKNKSTN